MAPRRIITLDQVYSLAPATEGADEVALDLCLLGASEYLEHYCGRVFGSGSFAAWHSGSRAVSTDELRGRYALYLAEPETNYATCPVTDVTSITEDGVSLNVFRLHGDTTFTDGQAAIVHDREGIVLRAVVSDGVISYSEWTNRHANIRASYVAGFKSDGGADPQVPGEIAVICAEIAWLMYRETRRVGIASVSELGSAASYDRLLPPIMKTALEARIRRFSPRTLAG